MFAQVAVWREENGRAVESASIPFDDADHDVDPKLRCEGRKIVNHRARQTDRAFPVPSKLVTALSRAIANNSPKSDPSRITGNEGFAEQHQSRYRRAKVAPDSGEGPTAILRRCLNSFR